jgi:hypothetical protein
MRRPSWILVAALLAAGAPARADIALSGLADFVARNNEDDVTNENFRPTSNLDMSRTRLFVDAPVDEHITFFTQFLISHNDFFIYGAYLRFEELGGSPVNLHAGLIPSTVGNWAPRTYSDRNPLVGVPLVWNHHTSLNVHEAQTSVEQLRIDRNTRTNAGLPVLYDNCWNSGMELWGETGAFDWSVGMLTGSTTLPMRERDKDLPQVTGRLGWSRGPGLVVGASGWTGPYLPKDSPALDGGDSKDFLNSGGGIDLSWTHRKVEVHSEVMRSVWEHPHLPHLAVTSGYLEGKVKVSTRWYVASRLGFLEPNRVRDSTGGKVRWDYPVHRAESGIGFRAAPRVTVKAVAQINRFVGTDAFDSDNYLLQLSAGF